MNKDKNMLTERRVNKEKEDCRMEKRWHEEVTVEIVTSVDAKLFSSQGNSLAAAVCSAVNSTINKKCLILHCLKLPR